MKTLMASVLLAAIATTTPGVSLALTCKPKALTGISTAINPYYITGPEGPVKAMARDAWDKICTQRYSGIWCYRKIAKSPKYVCNLAPNGLGGWRPVCEFSAIPCKN